MIIREEYIIFKEMVQQDALEDIETLLSCIKNNEQILCAIIFSYWRLIEYHRPVYLMFQIYSMGQESILLTRTLTPSPVSSCSICCNLG